jgi:alanyl-tRNA synthetase
VLRRILRRAVRYGRTLGFSSQQTFLPELVDTLVEEFGAVFPELKKRSAAIKENLQREEGSFNETLDRGLAMFEQEIADGKQPLCGEFAFKLYDTFGFPIDLTQLLCAERGLKVDMTTFEQHMEAQRERARSARTQQLVRAADIATEASTAFTGFDEDETSATVLEIHTQDDAQLIITDRTPLYTEMGGQLGDQGTLTVNGTQYPISAVQQLSAARAHSLPLDAQIAIGDEVTLRLDPTRRRPIEAHHTATHLLHWALHEIVSTDAAQQGSMVSRTRLRFDFNSGALTPEQIDAIENKVNACIEAGEPVSWQEVPHADIKDRKDIQQFFGDKYGEIVRVVQIGGVPGTLDGYSMELCGGTHVRNTKDIGIFKIKSEGAIASGVRRIEALCGTAAYDWVRSSVENATAEEKELRVRLNAKNEQLAALDAAPIQFPEMPHIIVGMLAEGNFEQKNKVFKEILAHLQGLKSAVVDADKVLKKAQAAGAAKVANALLTEQDLSTHIVLSTEGPAALLQELLNGLKGRQFANAAFCIVDDGETLYLGALCGAEAQSDGLMAGKLIQTLAPIAGGKGGGKPDMARGAASERSKVSELIAAAKDALQA